MNSLKILSLSLFLLQVSSLCSQIQFVQYPEVGNATCMSGVDPETHPDYLTWLQNYGGAIVTTSCSGGVTWTINTLEVIQDEGCYGGNVVVEWKITDNCGNEEYEVGDFIISTNFPTFEVYPSDLLLDCGDPNNVTVYNDWISSAGGAVVSDDCTPVSELTLTNDSSGNIPACGNSFDVNFSISESCTNITGEEAFAQVHMLKSVIEFSSFSYVVQEDVMTAEFCIDITEAALNEDLLVAIRFRTNSTTTNGVDHELIDPLTDYTLSAGAVRQECFEIDIYDDNIIEFDENILLKIASISSPINEAKIGGKRTAYIQIMDNDDLDNDGIENSIDNCPDFPNPFQEDIDSDGIGDDCDTQNEVGQSAELENNLFLNDATSGIILKDVNNACWMIRVNEIGGLKTISVECPENN